MALDTASWERIARYALGECTAEEAVATRAWIEADPERKALAGELTRLVGAGPTTMWDARAAWQRFRETVGEVPALRPLDVPESASGARATMRHHRRWLAAAAAVLLAASAVVWQTTRDSVPGVVVRDDLRSVTTQPGQTAELYLGDGTHVTLGVASELRFPDRFQGTRDVVLAGEAYFDVAPQTPSPWQRLTPWRQSRDFTVHTEHAVARDLGTRFSVRAYPGSTSTEVLVAEGFVALDSLILAPGDLGRIEENGSLAVLRDVDVDAHLAWMQGRLVFADAPLGEVLERFRHWYDVDLRVADAALAKARLTATFDTDSPREALELLVAVLDARIERHGQIVELHRRRHSG